MAVIDRKTFLQEIALLTGATLLSGPSFATRLATDKSAIKLGFVTYLWGKD